MSSLKDFKVRLDQQFQRLQEHPNRCSEIVPEIYQTWGKVTPELDEIVKLGSTSGS